MLGLVTKMTEVGSLIVGRTKKDVDFLEKALDREKKKWDLNTLLEKCMDIPRQT